MKHEKQVAQPQGVQTKGIILKERQEEREKGNRQIKAKPRRDKHKEIHENQYEKLNAHRPETKRESKASSNFAWS